MCAASTGSVMGYDEIFPKLLDLVSERRLYAPETEQPGIGKVKGVFNRLHTEMAIEGYTETHVHHEGEVRSFTIIADHVVYHSSSCLSKDTQGIFSYRSYCFQS